MSQQSLLAPSPLSQFEVERLQRIESNRRRMEEMGVLESQRDLLRAFKSDATKPPTQRKPRAPKERQRRHQPMRQSKRLAGEEAEHMEIKDDNDRATYSDCEGGLEDILADDNNIETLPAEKQQQFQEIRCSSTAGRGSVYDSVAGITCHFCRQKKLCGEEGCPRCSRRSTTAECIGKTECSRCHSNNGRFCRACLLIRYGQTLEDARKEMEAGTWLCPHCYEEDHPDEGWMCNSSICMKRRGFKPTGIAIYDAQQRGFPSVAHWLQAQMRKRGTNTTAACGDTASAGSAAAAGSGAVEVIKGSKAPAAVAAAASESCGSESVQAPATPFKDTSDVASSGTAAAGGGKPQRVTRAAAAADAVSKEPATRQCSSKRARVGESAGARRSLRMGRK